MAHDSLLDAFIDELDHAVARLQSARSLAAGISQAAARRHAGTETERALRTSGMTVGEAAARLGVGEEQVRRLLRRGDLKGVAFGGSVGWRLDPKHLEEVARRRAGSMLRRA